MPPLQVTRDVMVAVLPVLRHASSNGARWEGRDGITSCTSSTEPPHHAEEVNMKIADLREGDLLEDPRRGVIFVIRRIAPCGSCSCGWGEISYEEVIPNSPSGHRHVGRRLCKTFKQFERLRFLLVRVARGAKS